MELTQAERRLVDAAKKGEVDDYTSPASADNDAADGAAWDEARTVHADTIYQLVTQTNPAWPVHAKGVQIKGARIRGPLDFRGAQIECPIAFVGCYLDEAITLTDASARSIRLTGTHVFGIEAGQLTVDGSVFLNQGFDAKGEVNLLAAKIEGQLVCTRGIFENGLNADFLKVGTVAFNTGFNAKGEVSLVGAKIDGQLQCGGGTFAKRLNAGFLKVGSVFLNNGFNAKGDVNLAGAEIDGQLQCGGGIFEKGLNASALKVGSVFLGDGFTSKGVVRLFSATIDGALVCTGGTFENNLVADSLKVGRVLFNRVDVKGHVQAFSAKGEVSLVNAEIDAELNCSGGIFEGGLDLRRAHAGSLADDEDSWPAGGKLLLDGFDYTISSNDGVPRDAKRRLNWIERGPSGPKDPFLPQPYEQLARVLHAMGDDAGARKVSIKEQWELRQQGRLGISARAWNWFLYITVGYGYRAWFSIVWAVVVVAIGAAVFQYATFLRATNAKVSAPVVAAGTAPQKQPGEGAASKLPHPVLYSIDVFLPFADIDQKKTWKLDDKGDFFLAYQVWYLFEEIAGWVLTALLAAAATGLLKKQ
jgi:hypothetical protein